MKHKIINFDTISIGFFSRWIGIRYGYLTGLGNRLDLGFIKIVWDIKR